MSSLSGFTRLTEKANALPLFCLTRASAISIISQNANANLSNPPKRCSAPSIEHTVPYKKLVISGNQKPTSQKQAEPSEGQALAEPLPPGLCL